MQINKNIADEIKKDLKEKCLKTFSNFYEIDAATGEPFLPSIIEVYECLFGVLGEVLTENGFETEWQKYQPQIKKFLDSWKQCKNAGGKIKVIWYVLNLSVHAQNNDCTSQSIVLFEFKFEFFILFLSVRP